MRAPIRVVTAVSGPTEADLVAGLGGQPEVNVVRRCADLSDLLATAAAGLAQVAVLSADLRGLDGATFDRLSGAGCAAVVLAHPADPRWDRLWDGGGLIVLPAGLPASQVAAAVAAQALAFAAVHPARPGPLRAAVGAGPATVSSLGDPRAALPRAIRADAPHQDLDRPGRAGAEEVAGVGRVVVVWGPAGAPGRTTVAVGLSSELAWSGRSTLLVDADTTASAVAQSLGLLDEASGLVSACRAADRSTLDPQALARLAPLVADRWRVLTGLVRASRWPEVRGGAVRTVLQTARAVATWTVVDVAAGLEQDEELSYDTAVPRRHAATLAALAAADVVVAVGAAGPVGLQRLVRGLQELAEVTSSPPLVVVNRVRAGAVGPRPARQVRAALARYAGVPDPVLLPDDPAALDAAVLVGRSLAEHARSSPVRQGLLDLVTRIERGPAQKVGAQ